MSGLQMDVQAMYLSIRSREWMKEEVIVYLDCSITEGKYIKAHVTEERRENPLESKRRGVKDI